jgi:hypothetical protein
VSHRYQTWFRYRLEQEPRENQQKQGAEKLMENMQRPRLTNNRETGVGRREVVHVQEV